MTQDKKHYKAIHEGRWQLPGVTDPGSCLFPLHVLYPLCVAVPYGLFGGFFRCKQGKHQLVEIK